jgi:signal transduction histidine kinase
LNTPDTAVKNSFLTDERARLADIVFPLAITGVIALWHASTIASLPIAVRWLPALMVVLPLLSTGTSPFVSHGTNRLLAPFMATGLTAGTIVALIPSDPTATSVGLLLTAIILCVSAMTTTQVVTLTCASLAAVTLSGTSLVQGEVVLAVLLAPSILGCAAVLSWLAVELRWARQWASDVEQRLSVATADGQAGMFEIDVLSGQATYSTRFRQVLGYDGFSQFPPLPTDFMSSDVIWTDDRDRVQTTLRDAVIDHIPVTVECQMVTAMGEPRWVRLRASVRLGQDGTLRRIVGSIHDISPQKEADARARDFLSAATQEIRAPLTSIRGVHRLVSGGAFGELPDLATRMMSIADRSSARLEQLVDQLLELHRVTLGDIDLNMEDVDLEEAVRAALQASHEVHRDIFLSGPVLVSHACRVRADRIRLISSLTTLMTVGLDDIAGGVYVGVEVSNSGGIGTVVLTRSSSPTAAVLHRGLVGVLHTHRPLPNTDVTNVSLSTAKALLLAMGGMVKAWCPSERALMVRIDFVAVADPAAALHKSEFAMSSGLR